MRLIVVLLFSLLTGYAVACTVPPEHLYQRPYTLVSTTPAIVLARVVDETLGDRGYFAEYTFQTLEVLKGEDPHSFKLVGFSAKQEGVETTDFDEHRAPEFWAGLARFSSQPGDCNAYGVFEVGHDYLIFLRKESHELGFEPIKSDEDFWLEVVKTLITYQSQ